ncbi:uncharacterized protein LOC114751275 [Neltuma alba]|uniref:uncharacterized protein LOC114751275 n=1 Tax=Neltuma alba TaxID=207710 RepID=UPI0010A42511|nr:uncharacterized protein LOC114751275 [Prosopis alba]
MSTLGGDLEQNAPIDLDPPLGLHRPSPGDSSARPNEESGEERAWKEDLCHAICGNKWSDVKVILDQNPNALTSVISYKGRTALHVAAMFGNVTIAEELLKLLPPEFVLTPDSDGRTALLMVTYFSGNTQVAKSLVNKNSRTLVIPDIVGDLPVIVAFGKGYQEMVRYLYSVTPLECLTGRSGSRLLHHCLHAQCFASNHVCVDIGQEDGSQGDKAKLTKPGTKAAGIPALHTSPPSALMTSLLLELLALAV